MRDDLLNFRRRITETLERVGHTTVDDLQHAAAGEEFVFHERDVRLDAGGVAVHEEGDGAGGREHGDLRIAVAVLLALGERGVPDAAGFFLQIVEVGAGLDLFHGVAVELDDAEHGFDVVFLDRLVDAGAARVAVAFEGAHLSGDLSGGLVSFASHNRGERASQGAAFVGIVRQAVAHAERTEICEAQAERAEDVGIFRDGRRG